MDRDLYIEQTIRLLKVYEKSDDYKRCFFILVNAVKNMKETYFDILAEVFPDPELNVTEEKNGEYEKN